MGGLLMALRRARRDRRRDHRRGARDARQDAARARAARCDRRRRHRRRCVGLLQHLDLRGVHRGRRRRAGRQARQPRALLALRRRRRARRARRARSTCARTTSARCIHEAGIGFMFAPAHHPAMKNVGPTRVELGTRTIFNLLGPLSNPAGVKRQMVGVFSRQWVEPLAQVLKNLGSRARLGRARLRRPRRDHHLGPDLRGRARKRQGPHLRDHAGGRRPAARRSRRQLRGGDADANATALRGRARGQARARFATSR